jgi:ketosteroid isomerase-like protein
VPVAEEDVAVVRRGLEAFNREAWESFRADLLDLRDEGEGKVVQVYRLRGRGRQSGIDVDMQVIQVITVRDGRIFRRRIERR